MLDISAEISGFSYKPTMCSDLLTIDVDDLQACMQGQGSMKVRTRGDDIALSWWVSPKRTRSYPYARVYDTLQFSGKRVTVIPIYKDEGADGDRDFLQWDTISLMSLINVYVIISYYENASRNERYDNKITGQRFDYSHINKKLEELNAYQSDALHWNLLQADHVGDIGQKAISAYARIGSSLGVNLHSNQRARAKIAAISTARKDFIDRTRETAHQAQIREASLTHESENVNENEKSKITITNYLGGEYFFTADEARIDDGSVYLVEAKNSRDSELPSLSDIKDGFIKMMLFSNLSNVKMNNGIYIPIAALKLTSNVRSGMNFTRQVNNDRANSILKEANTNNFQIFWD